MLFFAEAFLDTDLVFFFLAALVFDLLAFLFLAVAAILISPVTS